MPPLLASTLVRVEGCLPFFYLLRQNVKLQTDKQTRSLEFPLKWFDILVDTLVSHSYLQHAHMVTTSLLCFDGTIPPLWFQNMGAFLDHS